MAAPVNAQSSTKSMQRVKVYCLNGDGEWDDRGTGHVSLDYMERSEELGLFVIDEDDNETLLVHRISTEDIYRKQDETVISWRDPERSTELALSFQEIAGCSHVWNQIYTTQQDQHFNSLNSETFNNVDRDLRELPDVEISNLPQILKIVTESDIADHMRLPGLLLKDPYFFENLMNVFEGCEKLKNDECLHMMFKIVKAIISLNSPQILEKIFGDELMMKIIGCLEYDPDDPQPQHHRNDLREHVVFKEVIPIKNPVVLSKIHQTYIIGYLKDLVLTRVLDDATAESLDSIINANKATVVTLLKDDSTFFQELFARLRSPSTSVESKNDLVHFLHEFCSLSKSLQMEPLRRLFRDLINEGIFDIIAEVLQIPEKQLVLTGIDILHIFLTPDTNLLCSYLVRPETPLLGLLVKGLMEDFGDKMLDIFRILLESNALSAQRPNIMDIFCEKHLPELVDFITASCPEKTSDTSESASRRVGSHCEETTKIGLLNICELLCFCVQRHPSRTMFFLQNVTEKVLFLTRRKEKPVVAFAIRFFRTLLSVRLIISSIRRLSRKEKVLTFLKSDLNIDIQELESELKSSGLLIKISPDSIMAAKSSWMTIMAMQVLRNIVLLQDDNVPSHVVKNNLLKPIIDVLVAGANQDNLVISAILELLEHIRKTGTAVLLKYVVDTFWDQLAPFHHLTSIQAFKLKNERCLKSWGPKSTTDPAESSAPSRCGGLVDYEDDKDDESNKTPPQKQPVEKREELVGLKRRTRCCGEDEEEQSNKKARFCSTTLIEGNKNSTEQGGCEAKEAEKCRSSSDGKNSDSSDEEKASKLGTGDDVMLKGDDDESALTPSNSSTYMDVHGS